jgi:O-antigen/teichoic acid export membrane protein
LSNLAAKGTLQLVVEQMFLTGSGYVAALVLAWGLGPERFGLYGVLISVLVWVQRTALLGVPTATTKLVAEGRQPLAAVKQSARAMGFGLVVAAFAGFWFGAPWLARIFQVPDQVALFRLAALDVPIYGMYLTYRGIGMGDRAFGVVFASGLFYGAAKLAGVLTLFWFGFSITTALIAYICGSIAGLLFLIYRIRVPPARLEPPLAKVIMSFALPLVVGDLGVSLLHHLDLWLLKALAGGATDREIGVYAAVRLLAIAPELALVPLAAVLFPVISEALARGDQAQAQAHIRGAARVLWIALLPVTALVAVEAEPTVGLLFPDQYAGGGAYLRIQVVGYGFMAALIVFLSILKARGDFYTVVAIGIGLVLLMSLISPFWISASGAIGAASALVATTVTGALISGVLVGRRFGPFLPRSVLVNGIVATGSTAAVAALIPSDGWFLVLEYAVLVALGGAILWALGELGREDLQLFLPREG